MFRTLLPEAEAAADGTGVIVTVRMPVDLVRALDEAAVRSDRTRSHQLRHVLREWAKHEETS